MKRVMFFFISLVLLPTTFANVNFSQEIQLDRINITANNNLSSLVNTSEYVYGVFLSYNNTNTSQRPFGELFDDFSILEFHLFNKSSNTKADITLTEEGYILKGLNISYNYENTGNDDLHLRNQFTYLDNGSDFTKYDYLGMKINVDTANKHDVKFRITATNITNSSHEVSCDTPFRTIRDTGWRDFTASMNDFTNGCNISNVHMLSFLISDTTDSDTDSGNIIVDELYLRTNTEFYIDDAEQYDFGETTNWANTDQGDNGTILSSNSTSSNGTNSINISYNYSSGQFNFSVLKNTLPYVLDISNFTTIGFYIRPDIANRHSFSAVVYDNASNLCEAISENASSADWTRFEWNISDLVGNCNVQLIEGPAINFSLSNSTDNGTNFISIDSFFMTQNTSTRVEFRYINQSLRTNETISWQICTNGTVINCSQQTSFNIDDFSYVDSATYQTDNSNLTSYLNGLNRLQQNTQDFVRANLKEQEVMQSILHKLVGKEYAAAIIDASGISYTITNFTQNETNESFYVVENSGTNRGWGYYVYAPDAEIDDLIVSIPHPLFDTNTRPIGADLYVNVSTQWLFLASAHRNTNFNELAEPVSDDNRQHPYYAAMLNLTNSSTRWLEIHGFAISSHPTYPNVTISQGNSTQSEITLAFSDNLSRFNISADVFNGTNYPDLAATKNVIGKYIRSIGADFIHSEISSTVRNDEELRNNYTIAAKNTFSPADLELPFLNITQPSNLTNSSDSNLAIEFEAIDSNLYSCWYTNDTLEVNTTISNCANITDVVWSQGEHNVTVFANDTSNNEGSSTIIFNTDSLAPAWFNNQTNITATSTGAVHFNITINETNTGYTIFSFYNGTNWTNDSAVQYTTNTPITTSKNLSITEGNINWTWYMNDSFDNTNQSDVWTITLAPPITASTASTETTSSSSGGGNTGGGGGASGGVGTSSTNHAAKTWTSIEPGESAHVEIADANSQPYIRVSFIAAQIVKGLTIRVILHNELPQNIPTVTKPFLDAFEVTVNQQKKENSLKDRTITFSLSKKLLELNAIQRQDVALYRFTDEWQALPIKIIAEDTTHVQFQATTPGFSYFIIGTQSIKKENNTEVIQEKGQESIQTSPLIAEEKNSINWFLIGIIVVVGLGTFMWWRKKSP